jgi:hypothetical protein
MTEQEIEAIKRNIEKQLDEYEQAIRDAAGWSASWKARQPRGFRINEKSA